MKFYYVTDKYINYLREYDNKVCNNKSQTRPYIGIVLTINNFNYYVPLGSPKPKHLKMKNTKDFRKIKGGEYGALNFNNMIPVPDSELIIIDINGIENQKYKRLLQNQYRAIKGDWETIVVTASDLHKLYFDDESNLSPYDLKIKSRCCNYKILEELCDKYT